MTFGTVVFELAQISASKVFSVQESLSVVRRRRQFETLRDNHKSCIRNSNFQQANNVLKQKNRHLQYQLHSFLLQAVGELLLAVLVNRHVADVIKKTPLGDSDIISCSNTPRLESKKDIQQARELPGQKFRYYLYTAMLQTNRKCSHRQEADTSMQITPVANVAPGWRRIVSNGEVVYVSPTGTILLTPGQIKDYLLSPTTCKCGLPCPLRPDKFFNFNCQVPNKLWKIPPERDSDKNQFFVCTHENKFLGIQTSINKGTTPSDIPASVKQDETIISNLQGAEENQKLCVPRSQDVTPKAKDQYISQQKLQHKIAKAEFPQLNKTEIDKKSYSPKLSPWRKSKGTKEQIHSLREQQIHSAKAFSSDASNVTLNERVPPLPSAHSCPSPCGELPAAEQGNFWINSSQHLLAKSATNTAVVMNKKRLNFKEDPTGYLDHQTAMLQGSILNAAHSLSTNNSSRNWGYTDILEKETAEQADHILEKNHSEYSSIENRFQQILSSSLKNRNLFTCRKIEIQQEDTASETVQLFQKSVIYPDHSSGTSLDSSNCSLMSKHGNNEGEKCNGFFMRNIAPFTAQTENTSANTDQQMIETENRESNLDVISKQKIELQGEPIPFTSCPQARFGCGQQRIYCMSTVTTFDECQKDSNSQPITSLCHSSSKTDSSATKNNNTSSPNVHDNNGNINYSNKSNRVNNNRANNIALDQKSQNKHADNENKYSNCIGNNISNSYVTDTKNRKNLENNKMNNSNIMLHCNAVNPAVNNSTNPRLMGLTASQQFLASKQTIQTIRNKVNPTIEQQLGDFVNFSQTNSTIQSNAITQVDYSSDNFLTYKPQKSVHFLEQKPPTPKQGAITTLTAVGPPSSEYEQKTNLSHGKNVCETSALPNQLVHHQIQFNQAQPVVVGSSQESPVSSSTAFNRTTPEQLHFLDNKGPAQVRAISTSNESSVNCSSPVEFCDLSLSSAKATALSVTTSNTNTQIKLQKSLSATSSTTSRNTITSVTAGKAITATTSIGEKVPSLKTLETNNIHQQHYIHVQQSVQQQRSPSSCFQVQKASKNTSVPATTNFSAVQLQSVVREPGNQLIMTSTGQLIVMPTQANKSPTQMIINNAGANNIVMNNQQSVVINQQSAVVNNSHLIGNSVDVISNQSNTTNIIQSPGSSLVIQNSGIVQTGQNIIHSPSNIITNNNTNFIVNSSSSIQPMILNNSNILQQGGQNLINANTANIMQTATSSDILNATNGSKVISSSGSILSNQNIMTNQSSVINNQVLGNTSNIISPSIGQAFVFNTIPNGYVLQPNFTTVDGQVVGQIVNQDNSTTILQQQQKQIILTSPDSKRKTKKRKGSFSSPSTPCNLSPQESPSIQQQASSITQATTQSQGTVVQLTPQYQTQGYHIGPASIQGITVLNKNAQAQPQILFQNGQLIQPLNLIGQQLIVPAGLVVAPETTLLQIQNVTPCGNILTPQSMVVRANSQNKNFLSSNAAGQQFLVGGNGQLSPIGQLYGTPVGLVIPPSNTGAATYVQQNTTIVQQQTTMMSNTDNTVTEQRINQVSVSPPDTTTHSPRSPERPSSGRSIESDMVQCVSSSEPDSVVFSESTERAQSPTSTDNDRYYSYQSNNNYKSGNIKIRRLDNSTIFKPHTIIEEITNQIRPDSHESSATNPATSTTTNGVSLCHNGVCGIQLSSFSIGELVWGAARGHPAWPGKIVSPPEGICTPSDSTWVQWFGGRSNFELVAISSLQSLSEGLDAHHKAQKDSRKTRKLNSQLERAIQEAMTELDHMSSKNITTNLRPKYKNRGRHFITFGLQRSKPVKIAPAPPCENNLQMRQKSNQMNRRQR